MTAYNYLSSSRSQRFQRNGLLVKEHLLFHQGAQVQFPVPTWGHTQNLLQLQFRGTQHPLLASVNTCILQGTQTHAGTHIHTIFKRKVKEQNNIFKDVLCQTWDLGFSFILVPRQRNTNIFLLVNLDLLISKLQVFYNRGEVLVLSCFILRHSLNLQ